MIFYPSFHSEAVDVFKRYLISFFIAAVALFVIAFYAERYYEGEMPHNLSREDRDELVVTIPAGQAYERCLSVQNGKRLEYVFEAAGPLQFNLHYHLEGDILYPVPSGSRQSLKSSYSPERKVGYYCMFWGNDQKEPVKLSLRYEVKNL